MRCRRVGIDRGNLQDNVEFRGHNANYRRNRRVSPEYPPQYDLDVEEDELGDRIAREVKVYAEIH